MSDLAHSVALFLGYTLMMLGGLGAVGVLLALVCWWLDEKLRSMGELMYLASAVKAYEEMKRIEKGSGHE